MLAHCTRHNLEFKGAEEVAKKMSRLWNQVSVKNKASPPNRLLTF